MTPLDVPHAHPLEQVVARAHRERHDRQRRIRPAARGKARCVHDEDVADVVQSLERRQHGGRRVGRPCGRSRPRGWPSVATRTASRHARPRPPASRRPPWPCRRPSRARCRAATMRIRRTGMPHASTIYGSISQRSCRRRAGARRNPAGAAQAGRRRARRRLKGRPKPGAPMRSHARPRLVPVAAKKARDRAPPGRLRNRDPEDPVRPVAAAERLGVPENSGNSALAPASVKCTIRFRPSSPLEFPSPFGRPAASAS